MRVLVARASGTQPLWRALTAVRPRWLKRLWNSSGRPATPAGWCCGWATSTVGARSMRQSRAGRSTERGCCRGPSVHQLTSL